ncbi:putative 39S ribosomal protein L24, mitochondrial [Lamellibrachia satsuma]|nr:putative 39S ribosomal protein L24, mitochondrial [Lamellibrachia satsuma]
MQYCYVAVWSGIAIEFVVKHVTSFLCSKVEVLVGKDKGKFGVISSIIKERNWVYVEGLNCEFKVDEQNAAGKAVCQKTEKPLLVTSQVKLLDPSDRKATDIEWRFTEKGERVRVSVRTGRIIPLPDEVNELDDFVVPKTYIESAKDTVNNEVTEVTFKPKLTTFNEDIMEAMGINEDRKRAKTYFLLNKTI